MDADVSHTGTENQWQGRTGLHTPKYADTAESQVISKQSATASNGTTSHTQAPLQVKRKYLTTTKLTQPSVTNRLRFQAPRNRFFGPLTKSSDTPSTTNPHLSNTHGMARGHIYIPTTCCPTVVNFERHVGPATSKGVWKAITPSTKIHVSHSHR